MNSQECRVLSRGCRHRSVRGFHDLAAIARGQIPAYLQQEQILANMPVFFRAIRGQEYDENDLREMIKDVRKLHQPGTEPSHALRR